MPPASTPPAIAHDDAKLSVFVIDDDDGMRASLLRLLKSRGLLSRAFPSAKAFLDEIQADWSGCVVADLWMPDMTGVELQAELLKRKISLPIILMSARPLVPDVVAAIQRGAVDFLQKPFEDNLLIERVERAFSVLDHQSMQQQKLAAIDSLLDRLTPREHEIMQRLVAGETTKEAAYRLGISPKTADVHRARILQKMKLDGVVDLVKLMHERSRLEPPSSGS